MASLVQEEGSFQHLRVQHGFGFRNIKVLWLKCDIEKFRVLKKLLQNDEIRKWGYQYSKEHPACTYC